MKLRWILIGLALAFASPATAGHKYGRQVRFAGIHPVPKGEGGGICYIEYPHVHIYTPNKLEYRVVDDDNVFVGDPVAYGWDGPKHAYKGHHPIQVNVVAGEGQPTTTWCYINGPHFHSFEPPDDSPDFKVAGDAYFYVGTPPPAYVEARPQYIGINAVYEPIMYTRPVVTVEPPSLWIGVRPEYTWIQPAVVVGQPGRHLGHPDVMVGGGAVVGGGVVVGGGISVAVPMPSVSVGVQIGGPAVIMEGGGHGKFKGGHGHGRH